MDVSFLLGLNGSGVIESIALFALFRSNRIRISRLQEAMILAAAPSRCSFGFFDALYVKELIF